MPLTLWFLSRCCFVSYSVSCQHIGGNQMQNSSYRCHVGVSDLAISLLLLPNSGGGFDMNKLIPNGTL
ncbi:uncharacterized protein BO80DRAFT_69560 [Aspergillus ibericus CBS 121593]|uniref:Secreted protein n=1 Tax=Aspergillus ibericus CBS 121593 TaxID=1448316 RepID=A0A395GZN9_9EURO|nr:hypothetical protein BO80DRAFT_69560 [Aspergillus ibericus CBS 121593]RAL01067.1 hypothetical protein BO80DRAFT_69560 [Aspergillus ibericus CBS 121593]